MNQTALSLTPPGADFTQDTADTNADLAMHHIRSLIERSITNAPRSLQTQIGPSEIGDPCDHCLAARLANWPKNEPTVAWLPYIGTSVHAMLEHLFTRLDQEAGGGTWLTEQRVTVGQIAGVDITGSTDLYVTHINGTTGPGMTVDWKIVGKNTLTKVKQARHPGPRYETQAHLYARGWNTAGHPTSHVAIYFMPRNTISLNDGWWWTSPYSEQKALDALARADQIARNLQALQTVSDTVRDQWISTLPRDPECWDCRKYKDYKPADVTALSAALGTHK